MADKRTRNKTPVINDTEYYSPLVTKRGVKQISHFKTPVLKNPTVADRRKIKTVTHIWAYGNRLYKLADQYYGDSTYWWVIAWYNGAPTEADLVPGDLITIPLELNTALNILGV